MDGDRSTVFPEIVPSCLPLGTEIKSAGPVLKCSAGWPRIFSTVSSVGWAEVRGVGLIFRRTEDDVPCAGANSRYSKSDRNSPGRKRVRSAWTYALRFCIAGGYFFIREHGGAALSVPQPQ